MNQFITNRFAIALCALLFGTSLQAAILDQSYLPGPSPGGYFLNSTAPYAQIFKAGLTGQVDSIDVQILNYFGGATAPLTLELWTVSNPTLNPATLVTQLAGGSINQASIPTTSGFVHYDLTSSGATFISGQDYALVLRTTSGASYLFEGNTSAGTYADGSGRNISGSGLYVTLAGPNLDFGFKTFVVPEPSSFLAGAALFVGGIFFVRRQRKCLPQMTG